jgi:predicted nucleotidyltransferase
MKQDIVNKLQSFFPAYPIEKAWIFGSYARGEETRKSDIDIMVKFDEDAGVSLFDFIRIMNKLQDTLHKKVDLVTEGGIKKFAKESIEHDKVLIYERDNAR